MIDTKALKKRIYDMAISGQLTHRLLDDTPVDSSILSYQEEDVDALPEIPVKWKYCYFDDVLINRDSKRIPVSVADRKKLNKKYDYYGASGVIDKVDNFLFDENLLLIGEDGANLLSRSTPIAFIAKGKYWVNNHAHVLQATEHVLLEFIEIYINAISLVPYVTGSAQPKLSQHMMSKIPVPVPPIEEQQRIVEIVRTVIDHIDFIDTLQSQYQDNLATLKSKIIDAAIQGKLTEQLPEDGTAEELYQQIHADQGIEKKDTADINADLPEIPYTWRWVRLGDIVRVLGGKRIPAGRKLTTENTGHKYIRISDMKDRSVDTERLLFVPEDIYPSIAQYIIRKEDVYITVAGTIGRVGKIPESIDGANLTENADRLVFSHLDQDWLIFCLSSTFVQKQIDYLTTQVAQPKLAIKRIQEFLVPLPPLAEQKRIVAKLEELLAVCEEKKEG